MAILIVAVFPSRLSRYSRSWSRLEPNARWSLDFVHDQLANGRRFRILNIVDDVTRECLAAIPDTSIPGRRVARELTALIDTRHFIVAGKADAERLL